MKTDIIKMQSNQVSTIPDMLYIIETGILQIKTEILNTKTATIQMKFCISNMKNETIKKNIQIIFQFTTDQYNYLIVRYIYKPLSSYDRYQSHPPSKIG